MGEHVLVWDLETIPDLAAVGRVNDLDEADLEGARTVLGGKFPRLPFHSIACIGALIAERIGPSYQVRSIGAPHIGERSEGDLIQSFADKIAALRPRMVTWNGAAFELPVLRYRGMIHRVCAPGLDARGYYKRYTDDALDLCDVLACFDNRGKMSLNDFCRALGYPGKPDDIDGSQVAAYVVAGRITEVAAYAETDVVSTYRLYLRYELFRGALTRNGFEASEANLTTFIAERLATKPHLAFLLGPNNAISSVPHLQLEVPATVMLNAAE
jgi:3'-5' exonuclease